MSADRLREAAAVLRERAGETHDGPWDHVVSASEDHAWVERRHIETVVRTHDIGTSAYIAMMHPPVARSLADWLDDLADHDPSPLMPTEAGAFKVADEILGGDR